MRLRIALVTLLATGAASAFAQSSDRFRSLDRNADGFVSRDEASQIPGYERAFDEADENRDGRLNADEFFKAESIQDRQQLGKAMDDSLLTAKVKAALLRERGVKSTDVKVQTRQATVLLSGFVDSEDQKQRALRVASHVDGVKEVRDGLSVR
jgi:hyperosmotically inducible protein